MPLARDQRTRDAINRAWGQQIVDVQLDSTKDELSITFDSGERLLLWDDNQSCCEPRWLTTDDDLPYYVGSRLTQVEVRDGSVEESDSGALHESEFLLVTTSVGTFTVVSHVEHDGYYGGFNIQAKLTESYVEKLKDIGRVR